MQNPYLTRAGNSSHFLFGLVILFVFLNAPSAGKKARPTEHDHQKTFFDAVKRGDLNVVKKLIRLGANANQATKDGITALHLASEHGHISIVRLLLGTKVDVNTQAIDGSTPLCSAKTKEIAKLLIDAGADINGSGLPFRSPLFLAATNGRAEVVDVLLNNGIKKIPKGLMVEVTFFGQVDVLKLLIDRGGDVNEDYVHGTSPLQVASLGGLGDSGCPKNVTPAIRLKMAVLLIGAKANVNDKMDHGFFADHTPLHGAAQSGHAPIVRLLLKHNAKLNAVGRGKAFGGWTPLHVASNAGHFEVTKLLIQAGAPINAKTSVSFVKGYTNKTPLDLAKTQQLRKLLKKHGGKSATEFD